MSSCIAQRPPRAERLPVTLRATWSDGRVVEHSQLIRVFDQATVIADALDLLGARAGIDVILTTETHEDHFNGARLDVVPWRKLRREKTARVFSSENINEEAFDVASAVERFLDSGGRLLACGTCLELRHQEAGVCPISTMSELVEMITESDKVVTLG